MDAKERAEQFFANLILSEDSEVRNGAVYLIARVIHDGMEWQKQRDIEIAKKMGNENIARAIEIQITEIPEPKSLLQKLLKFWGK